jgi:hypothetical protein
VSPAVVASLLAVLIVGTTSLWVLADAQTRLEVGRPVTATIGGLTVDRPERPPDERRRAEAQVSVGAKGMEDHRLPGHDGGRGSFPSESLSEAVVTAQYGGTRCDEL